MINGFALLFKPVGVRSRELVHVVDLFSEITTFLISEFHVVTYPSDE